MNVRPVAVASHEEIGILKALQLRGELPSEERRDPCVVVGAVANGVVP